MEAAGIRRRGARGGGSKRWRWSYLKRRLGCCGSSWAFSGSSPDQWVREDEAADGAAEVEPETAAEAMNLAAALAAERRFRAASAHTEPRRDQLDEGEGSPRREGERASPPAEGAAGWWCCVCMGRRRGAAFVPCGHTLCRGCSREVWLKRGACPLCNRPILDVLDIF